MNRLEFIRAFAEAHEITLRESRTVCNTVLNFLSKTIENEDKLYIYGLGTFKHKKQAAHRVLHPITKESVNIPERDVIVFVKTTPEETDVVDGGVDDAADNSAEGE